MSANRPDSRDQPEIHSRILHLLTSTSNRSQQKSAIVTKLVLLPNAPLNSLTLSPSLSFTEKAVHHSTITDRCSCAMRSLNRQKLSVSRKCRCMIPQKSAEVRRSLEKICWHCLRAERGVACRCELLRRCEEACLLSLLFPPLLFSLLSFLPSSIMTSFLTTTPSNFETPGFPPLCHYSIPIFTPL